MSYSPTEFYFGAATLESLLDDSENLIPSSPTPSSLTAEALSSALAFLQLVFPRRTTPDKGHGLDGRDG